MIRFHANSRALMLFVTVFVALLTGVAARKIHTELNVRSEIQQETRTQLDLEVIDSFGTPIPWGDLHLHHGRKMHVYVVHEGLECIQHVHPDDFKDLTATATTFSISLVFPLPGAWILHVSYVVRSNHNVLGEAVTEVHQLKVTDSNAHGQMPLVENSHSRHTKFGLSAFMAQTDIQTMHEETGMVKLPTSPDKAALQARLRLPKGGLWRGHCHRLLLHFNPSDRSSEQVHLVPFLGAGMHVFVSQRLIQDPSGREVIHAHGFPEKMDVSMSARAEETGSDMCNMDVHSMEQSDGEHSFGPNVVMYIRFSEAGPYALFPQVAMGGRLHIARIDVMVQDVLVDMESAASNSGGISISFSVLKSVMDESKLPMEQHTIPNTDVPCMTMINAALTWTGSVCLSACKTKDARGRIQCPVPFPADGDYCIFTAGIMVPPMSDIAQDIPVYARNHVTKSVPSEHKHIHGSHAVNTVRLQDPQGGFVGGYIGKAEESEGIDVQLVANGGMTVYAGSCAFLQLIYRRRSENGTFVEIDDLQTIMRSAARILVVLPDQSETELLVAHSLKESLARPWDFLGSSIQEGTGAMLWSPSNPCLPGLQRTLSPRVTGDLGGRVGQYFRFSQSGTYIFVAQAQSGTLSIISRHNVTVCDWHASGVWSNACMWNLPPAKHSNVRIEEGMELTLDVAPPPLTSLTVAGTLMVSPKLSDIIVSAGTISVLRDGALLLGSRKQPFVGAFELNLNNSLHEFGSHAVSYLDVYGSLQLKSAEVEAADETVPSWTAITINKSSFTLEGGSSFDAIERGSRLGVVSSRGEEVVTVESFSKGHVTVTDPLTVAHGNKAIVYNLSRSIRITGSGRAALRIWNGQPDAGGSVDVKPPGFHHHRRLHRARHASGERPPVFAASLLAAQPASIATRRILTQSTASTSPRRSDVGYRDTNIYKSSLKQPQLAGKLELHGVEISGLGVPSGPQKQPAISMSDFSCAVRWPEFRKYISLMSVSMHSLKAGCIDFHGCTGGLEIQTSLFFGSQGDGVVLRPQDVLQSPPWRIGIGDSIVHISADAGAVRSGMSHMRSPAALLVGNAAMPTGSVTHGLGLHVTNSFFINPLGPGVVWSPGVPGRLENCEARGEDLSIGAYFASCVRKVEHEGFELQTLNTTASNIGQPGPGSLLGNIMAVPVDDSPVDIISDGSRSHPPMAHMHIHVPPEAVDMAVIVNEVQGSDKLWATLTWPAASSLWSDMEQLQPEMTGGIPCIPGARGCSAAHNISQRADNWFFNEAVDGPLQPAGGKPVEFAFATKGEGVYGVGLTAFIASKPSVSDPDVGSFQATVAVDVQRCSPGYVPVAVAPETTAPDVVPWRSQGMQWYSQCVLPARVSLNQPTRGFVVTGTGLEYFRFYVPQGVRSLFLMVEILYSDESDVMLDFYATRNLLWTKHTPFDTAPEALHILPLLQRDADTSSRMPLEVTDLLDFPPWGNYYGVLSQGAGSSLSKTEVEITVVTTEDVRAHKLLMSANADTDAVLRSTHHTVADIAVTAGRHKFQMGPNDANGTAQKCFRVEVPNGAQLVQLSVQPSAGAKFHACYDNWCSPASANVEIQSLAGNFVMHAEELYGRWGTWFTCLSFMSDSLPVNGDVEVHLNVTGTACVGVPVCSGNGMCMQDDAGSMWCQCHPGWYGHVCEIQASSIHGGVYEHLPDQLLISLDSVLSKLLSSDTVHLELRAPILAAAAVDEEMTEVFGELFGNDMCQIISVEPSYHNANGDSKPDATRQKARSAPAAASGSKPGPAQNPPASDLPMASSGTRKPSPPSKHHAALESPSNPASASNDTSMDLRQTQQVHLLLPGAAPEIRYAMAVAEILSTSTATDRVDVMQAKVLVTAYQLHAQLGNSSGDGAAVIAAFSAMLAAHVHTTVGSKAEVTVMSAAAGHTGPSAYGRDANASQSHRGFHGWGSSASSGALLAGVIISQVTSIQRAVLEDRLIDASVSEHLRKAANQELLDSGASISKIIPGLILASVLLTVSCTSAERLCGRSAEQWDSVVRTAAATEHLQQPDDMWVFEVDSDGLTPVSEDFESVALQQNHFFPWRALILWGAATLAALLAAVAVYAAFSRTRWRQPRITMWEGYSAVGRPAGAVGEAISGGASPLSMSDVSPLARGSTRMRLTRNSSVMDYYRAMTGYGPLAPVEQTWSGRAGRRSSLMSPSLVCRIVDDELQGTPTMPSLTSGISYDSQPLRGAARTSTTEAMLTRHVSTGNASQLNMASLPEPDSSTKPVRLSLFSVGSSRTTQSASPDLPELHASCMPATDHLPAYKAWMKGSRSQKHADWLRGRRWSLLTRSAATSLSEAVDLSLSSMTPVATPPLQLHPESLPCIPPCASPAGKLAVINELPHGQSATESDEAHMAPYFVSESFPRASRKASAGTTSMPYAHDDVEDTSGHSAAEAPSGAEGSSAHDSRLGMDESIGDIGPPSTDMPSCSASQDAQLRDEMGISRAANMGVSCILQARTHQWVSGVPDGDDVTDLPNEYVPSCVAPAVTDSADGLHSPVFIHIGTDDC
eukprot:jgi/Ulvmu1/10528/UM064_0066.1